jgi:hypothetical protein
VSRILADPVPSVNTFSEILLYQVASHFSVDFFWKPFISVNLLFFWGFSRIILLGPSPGWTPGTLPSRHYGNYNTHYITPCFMSSLIPDFLRSFRAFSPLCTLIISILFIHYLVCMGKPLVCSYLHMIRDIIFRQCYVIDSPYYVQKLQCCNKNRAFCMIHCHIICTVMHSYLKY